jgi:hypothetical protein
MLIGVLLLTALGLIDRCTAQAIKVAPFPVPEGSFRAGGVSLVLPSPSGDLVEMGPDMRVVAEVLVPITHRLVAAFIPPDDLADIAKGAHRGLARYSLVEVPRAAEFVNIDETTFNTIVESTKKTVRCRYVDD